MLALPLLNRLNDDALMEFVTMLEMVVRGVSGSFLQISQYRVGVEYGKGPEEPATVFP